MKILYIDFGNNPDQTKKEKGFLDEKYRDSTKNPGLFTDVTSPVVVINLQQAILEYRRTDNFDQLMSNFAKLKDINEFNQIIIGAHGIKGDVRLCYSKPSIDEKMVPLCSAEELAEIVFKIFKALNLNSKKEIPLMICYAGRTAEHERDHINEQIVTPLNTFAYRFFSHLCPDFDFSMIAGTGAIRIGDTGEFEVETEDGIKFIEEKNRISKLYKEAKTIFENQRKEFIEKHGIDQWTLYEDGGFESSDTKLNKICQQYVQLQETLLELTGSDPDPKVDYGIIKYKYDKKDNKCTITLAHQGTEKVLYQDILLRDDSSILEHKVDNSSKKCSIQ